MSAADINAIIDHAGSVVFTTIFGLCLIYTIFFVGD